MTQTLVLYVPQTSWDTCSKLPLSSFPRCLVSGRKPSNTFIGMKEVICRPISSQNYSSHFQFLFLGMSSHTLKQYFVLGARPSRAIFSLCHQLSATSNIPNGTCFISLGPGVRIMITWTRAPTWLAMAIKQKLERDEHVSHANMYWKSIGEPGQRPQGTLVCSRNSYVSISRYLEFHHLIS